MKISLGEDTDPCHNKGHIGPYQTSAVLIWLRNFDFRLILFENCQSIKVFLTLVISIQKHTSIQTVA